MTFWHPECQSETLLASDGMRVALERRGRIVGTADAGFDPGDARLDGDGEPIVLQDGSFVFEERLDAGFHVVELLNVDRSP